MKGLAGQSGQIVEGLGGVAQALPLEINTCKKLLDIADEVGRTFQLFEGKRMKALHEWCKKDEKGKLITTNGKPDGPADFEDGAYEEYSKAFSLIANEDIEYSFDPIPLKLLTHRASGKAYVDKDGEPVTLFPSILAKLKPILKGKAEDGEADSE